MKEISNERRKYSRYDTEVKVYFRVTYDIKTIVKFQIIEEEKEQGDQRKYSAISKNVSAEGICFCSNKRLEKGDILYLEVYLPGAKNPIRMKGDVRWSRVCGSSTPKEKKYDTGVQLVIVNKRPVSRSIHFDEKNNIVWSNVLESVFGSFRRFVRQSKSKVKQKSKGR
ncbi:MAG: PilZ domain-containing protein [Candidatus Omnitrophota bacterium]